MAIEAARYHPDVSKRVLLPIVQASKETGISEPTIWRWLAAGVVKRYKSKPGGPRRTLVDVDELKRVREVPPPAD